MLQNKASEYMFFGQLQKLPERFLYSRGVVVPFATIICDEPHRRRVFIPALTNNLVLCILKIF
jgi:hypothetical protein